MPYLCCEGTGSSETAMSRMDDCEREPELGDTLVCVNLYILVLVVSSA